MATRTAEAKHQPDRVPSEEEVAAADEIARRLQEPGDERSVAEHYEEMSRLGAEAKGEGCIE